VSQLVESLNNSAIRLQATDALRGLVEKVVVGRDAEAKTHTVQLVGELAALLGLGANGNAAAYEAAAFPLKLVARAGFGPAVTTRPCLPSARRSSASRHDLRRRRRNRR